MTQLRIEFPGTLCGPCAGICDHIECREMREIADMDCPLCRHPIGFDDMFVTIGGWGPAHSQCYFKSQKGEKENEQKNITR